jgi:hypothetical protein
MQYAILEFQKTFFCASFFKSLRDSPKRRLSQKQGEFRGVLALIVRRLISIIESQRFVSSLPGCTNICRRKLKQNFGFVNVDWIFPAIKV